MRTSQPTPASDAAPGRAADILFLNGKFYGGAINGVHRVADRLLRELDALATAGGRPAAWDMRLLLPGRTNRAPDFTAIRPIPQRFGHSQAWEQLLLPRAARGGALASFANLAPSFHPRQLTMVHDAQFRLSPESYPFKLRHGYRALIPRGARASRIVLTVSDYARDSLATFGIADPAHTRVLYNGGDHILERPADAGVLARHGLVPGGYAVMFGSAARYKNIGVAFDALRGVDAMPLVVIGPDRARLQAAGLGPPANAVFVGGVDDAALRALYEGAAALLYPSRTEGFGLPPVEAMLCDCPVIAAPAGAVPEVCRDAILYAGMDAPVEWAEQLAALCADPALRTAKIAAGRARAAAFTWRAAGERLAECLAPLVEGR